MRFFGVIIRETEDAYLFRAKGWVVAQWFPRQVVGAVSQASRCAFVNFHVDEDFGCWFHEDGTSRKRQGHIKTFDCALEEQDFLMAQYDVFGNDGLDSWGLTGNGADYLCL